MPKRKVSQSPSHSNQPLPGSNDTRTNDDRPRPTGCWKDRVGAALCKLGQDTDFWRRSDHAAATIEEIRASSTVFYTAPVVCSPSVLDRQIGKIRGRLHNAAIGARRKVEDAEMQRLIRILDDLRDRRKNPDGYRSKETEDAEDAFLNQRHRMLEVADLVPDPTTLLIIDEAGRLRMAGLEQTRSIFDGGGIGMILIGMPGIEKRLARYPQFYSRIGFVHEFRTLSSSEIQQLLEGRWTPPGVKLPGESPAATSVYSIGS